MKKLSIVILLTFAMIFCLGQVAFADDIWDGRTSEPFAGGSGTAEDPYLIANGAQLYYLSLNCADSTYNTASYRITNDIYLGDYMFSPISNFSGTLDGDGYAIFGLKVVSYGSNYAGLILNGANCEIKNLSLSGSVQGESYTGGFVAYLTASKITNCINHCTVIAEDSSAGGIVGVIHFAYAIINNTVVETKPSSVIDCINKGDVYGYFAGGIVGSNGTNLKDSEVKSKCTFNNCINHGTITGRMYVGGIAGRIKCYQMNRCVNVGTVCGTLTNSSNGKGNIGGLVGSSNAGEVWNSNYRRYDYYPSYTSDSYNTGKITINGDYYYVGGIWGYSNNTKNTVTRCYNVGLISGSSTCSDICPVTDHFVCSNSYYLADLNNGAINPAGSVGNSEVDMRLPAGFSGFDFNNVWGWDESDYYPYPILKDIGIVACMHVPADVVQERIVSATCEEPGGYDDVVYCSVCGEELSRTRVIVPAIGHKWSEPVWYWSGNTSAMASFTCQNDNNHTRIIPATIDSSTVAATCEEAGKTIYTATVTLDGVSYSDSKEKPIPALKHDWHFVDFTWTGSETDGYTAAVANFICLNNGSHTDTLDAVITTATSENRIIYTASVGAEISLDNTEHVESLGITGYTVKLDDRTYEAAVITGVDNGGIYMGNVTFTVSCGKPYTVMYTVDDGGSYTRLAATDGENYYTLNVTTDLTIVVTLKGDINGDGDVNNKDVTRLMRYIKYKDVEVVDFALDVNGDGSVNNKDVTRLMRYIKYNDVEIS